MGKALPHSQDHVRSVATKQRYSADERELGTTSAGLVLPTHHIAINPGDSGSVKDAHGRISPTATTSNGKAIDGHRGGNHTAFAADNHQDGANTSMSARASLADKSKAESSGDPAIADAEPPHEQRPIPARMAAGCKRFFIHMKNAMC